MHKLSLFALLSLVAINVAYRECLVGGIQAINAVIYITIAAGVASIVCGFVTFAMTGAFLASFYCLTDSQIIADHVDTRIIVACLVGVVILVLALMEAHTRALLKVWGAVVFGIEAVGIVGTFKSVPTIPSFTAAEVVVAAAVGLLATMACAGYCRPAWFVRAKPANQ